MSDIYLNAIRLLVEKECYWNSMIINQAKDKGKKYVIFPAGPTAINFYSMLKEECGIDIEFFVDNNPDLVNTYICEKQIKSFAEAFLKNANNNYLVLIPTSDKYCKQIIEQIESAGIEAAYLRADAYMICHLLERCKKVENMLEDELSKKTYWGSIYSSITGNNRFVIIDSLPCYFGINEFSYLENEIIADVGAYVGDTVEQFINRSNGAVKKIYAFEPFNELIIKINQRKTKIESEWALDDDVIDVIQAGIGKETKKHYFTRAHVNSSMLKSVADIGDIEISVWSLDDFFRHKEPFTLLKADIEGGEMDMLKGACKMIKKYKPKMALCIYHSSLDFVRIAEFIRSLVPEYRFYVRSHYYNYGDTVLYCVF